MIESIVRVAKSQANGFPASIEEAESVTADKLSELLAHYRSDAFVRYGIQVVRGMANLAKTGGTRYLQQLAFLHATSDPDRFEVQSNGDTSSWSVAYDLSQPYRWIVTLPSSWSTRRDAVEGIVAASRYTLLAQLGVVDHVHHDLEAQCDSPVVRLDRTVATSLLAEIVAQFPRSLAALDRLDDLTTSPFQFSQWADLERIDHLIEVLSSYVDDDQDVYQALADGLIAYGKTLKSIEVAKFILEDGSTDDAIEATLCNLNDDYRSSFPSSFGCQSWEFSAYLRNRLANQSPDNGEANYLEAIRMIVRAVEHDPKRRYLKYAADYVRQYGDSVGDSELVALGTRLFVDGYVVPSIAKRGAFLKRLKELYPEGFAYLSAEGKLLCPKEAIAELMDFPSLEQSPDFAADEAKRWVNGRTGFPLDLSIGVIMLVQRLRAIDNRFAAASTLPELSKYLVFHFYILTRAICLALLEKNEYFHGQASAALPIQAAELAIVRQVLEDERVSKHLEMPNYLTLLREFLANTKDPDSLGAEHVAAIESLEEV